MSLADLNPFAGGQQVTLIEGSPTSPAFAANTVTFDASKDEDHTGENDVTEFPVEEGSDVTDNSRPKPRTVNIHAFVTGTPVSLTNIARPTSTLASRGKDAWTQMDKWRQEGTRLTALTTLFAYINVVIAKLSVPRSATNSDGIEFTVSLKEVKTVSSKTVPKPVRDTKQDSSNIGSKPTTSTSPPVEAKADDLLRSVSNVLGRFLGSPR